MAKASGLSYQQYYARNLASRTGVGRTWLDGVLYSKPRAMARFELMLLDGGRNGDTILHDREYFNAMKNTSQDLNLPTATSSGSNGQGAIQPGIPFRFLDDIIPSAPMISTRGLARTTKKSTWYPVKASLWCAWATRQTMSSLRSVDS
ncbi:MAG: hypothetical protein IPM83_03565 [Ignavibacteria bacterium]|nr:hypothetical protein [Ignavibacteria bacterium]